MDTRNVSRCDSISDDGMERLVGTAPSLIIRQTSADTSVYSDFANNDRALSPMMLSAIDSGNDSPVLIRRTSIDDLLLHLPQEP